MLNDLRDKVKVFTDRRGKEYKFEQTQSVPTMFKYSTCRHDITVTITYVYESRDTWRVSYKSNRQKFERGVGSSHKFDDTITYVEKLFSKYNKLACMAAEKREKATQAGDELLNQLKVGSILYASWGHSMTIVDFYKVKSIKGKKVTLVELGNKAVTGDLTTGEVVPDESVEGDIKECMVRSGRVKVRDSADAKLWDGTPKYQNRMD